VCKAKQLKEFRRTNNLCFKCGGKYTPAHKCASPEGTLHMMEQFVVDGGEFLSEALLAALESP
jgi:hypothetical protein